MGNSTPEKKQVKDSKRGKYNVYSEKDKEIILRDVKYHAF